MKESPSAETHVLNRHVLVGLAIMLVGVALMTDRGDGWNLEPSGWWPLLLLFLGALRMIDPALRRGRRRSRRSGAVADLSSARGGWSASSSSSASTTDLVAAADHRRRPQHRLARLRGDRTPA